MWKFILFISLCSLITIYLIHSIINYVESSFIKPIIHYDNEVNEKIKKILDSISGQNLDSISGQNLDIDEYNTLIDNEILNNN